MAEQRSANLPLCRQRLEHIIYAVGVYVNKNLFLTKAGTSDRISTKNEEQGCVTFMKRSFMKSPSFALQNSCRAAGELGYAERSQELKPYEPEADNTDGGSISFSQAYCNILGASAPFRKFFRAALFIFQK